TGFSLPMGTVAIGSRIVLTMKVMPTRGGVFENYVRVSSGSTDPNLWNNTAVDELTVVPKPPRTPDLRASSDTGLSSTDDYTADNSPTFEVKPAQNDATVQLLRDGLVVATRVGPGLVTDPGPVADGTYHYSAYQVDTLGIFSPESDDLEVT